MPRSVLLALCLLPLAVAELVHVPLHRNSLPAARAFSLRHRPWAAPLATDANVQSPTLNFPLKLLNHTKTLPEHPIFGSIIPLGEYFVTLTFGGQPINVQIDTGSSTIAVPLKECLNCRRHDHRLDLSQATGTSGFIRCDSPACRQNTCHLLPSCRTCSKKTRACCSAVAPSACGFYLQYADMSGASGALVQADVGVAGMTVPLAFGAILQETEQFESTSVDGIFGLAYKSLACNPTCVVPLFDTLVQSGKVKHDVFSICTGPEGGTLTLGGSNPNLYRHDLQYVPMIHKGTPHFYDVAVRHVMVGDRKVKVPNFSDAIVDSGTTVLVVAPKAYQALRLHFQTYYCNVPGLCVGARSREADQPAQVVRGGVKDGESFDINNVERVAQHSWFSPGYCARLTEAHISMLPDIVIALENGVTLVLDPETYMLRYETTGTFGWERIVYRCLGIAYLDGLDHMENNVILGDTVLQKYFVEYDRENDRIGFAVAKNCYDPSSRQLGAIAAAESKESGWIPSWLSRGLTIASLAAWAVVVWICVRDARKRGYSPIPGETTAT